MGLHWTNRATPHVKVKRLVATHALKLPDLSSAGLVYQQRGTMIAWGNANLSIGKSLGVFDTGCSDVSVDIDLGRKIYA